jgi:hypothetical protein
MKVDGACHCGSIVYEAEIDPGRAGTQPCAQLRRSTYKTLPSSSPSP